MDLKQHSSDSEVVVPMKSHQCENQNDEHKYESLKNDVVNLLQKKINHNNYKKTIRKCEKMADKAFSEEGIGLSLRPLMKVYKKLLRSKQ